MKDLLTEIKIKINEESGIADEVNNMTNNIINNIIMNSRKNKGVNFVSNSFNFVENNISIKVNYQLFRVATITDIDSLSFPFGNNGLSKRTNNNNFELKTIIIYIKDLNKYIDYDGTTQHEVEHIFQMLKSNSDLIEKPKSKSLYNKAINLITGTKDFYHNIIGFVIYYNNKFEKDAFINDTYRMLMDNPLTQFETLVNNKTYININIIKKYIVDSDKLKTKLIPILKNELNKNYNWFYNMASKVVKNYINKFGKIYVKAQKDINEQYTILDNNFNNILLELPPLA